MKPLSVAASGTARGLWLLASGVGHAPDVGATNATNADQLWVRLRVGLGRWIGQSGYRALLDRALVMVRADHPFLTGLSFDGDNEAAFTAALRTHGDVALAEAMVALIAAVIELLGRIVGLEMAMHLVEEIGRPSPRGPVSMEGQGGPNA